jgi:hypothetical protein
MPERRRKRDVLEPPRATDCFSLGFPQSRFLTGFKIAVENDTAVNFFATVAIGFIAKVIDEKVAVDCPGKRDQGGDHLNGRADRVDEIQASIPGNIRRENIIGPEGEPFGNRHIPDIGTTNGSSGIMEYACYLHILTNPDLNGIGAVVYQIFADARLNMFIGAHSNRI